MFQNLSLKNFNKRDCYYNELQEKGNPNHYFMSLKNPNNSIFSGFFLRDLNGIAFKHLLDAFLKV